MSSGHRLRERVGATLLRAKRVGPSWARPDETNLRLRCLWAVLACEGSDGAPGALALVEEMHGTEADYYLSWLIASKHKNRSGLTPGSTWSLHEILGAERIGGGGEGDRSSATGTTATAKESTVASSASPRGSFELKLLLEDTKWGCAFSDAETRDDALWRILAACRNCTGSSPHAPSMPPEMLVATSVKYCESGTFADDPLLRVLRLDELCDPSAFSSPDTPLSGASSSTLSSSNTQPTVSGAGDKAADRILADMDLLSRGAIGLDDLLVMQMEKIERETVECLLAWEPVHHQKEGIGNRSSGGDAVAEANPKRLRRSSGGKFALFGETAPPEVVKHVEVDGKDAFARASVLHHGGVVGAQPLLQTLDKLDAELAHMEDWLQSNKKFVDSMRSDMLNIEEHNNQLETRSRNYEKVEQILGSLLDSIVLAPEVIDLLEKGGAILERAEHHDVEDCVMEITGALGSLSQAITVANDGFPTNLGVMDELNRDWAIGGTGREAPDTSGKGRGGARYRRIRGSNSGRGDSLGGNVSGDGIDDDDNASGAEGYSARGDSEDIEAAAAVAKGDDEGEEKEGKDGDAFDDPEDDEEFEGSDNENEDDDDGYSGAEDSRSSGSLEFEESSAAAAAEAMAAAAALEAAELAAAKKKRENEQIALHFRRGLEAVQEQQRALAALREHSCGELGAALGNVLRRQCRLSMGTSATSSTRTAAAAGTGALVGGSGSSKHAGTTRVNEWGGIDGLRARGGLATLNEDRRRAKQARKNSGMGDLEEEENEDEDEVVQLDEYGNAVPADAGGAKGGDDDDGQSSVGTSRDSKGSSRSSLTSLGSELSGTSSRISGISGISGSVTSSLSGVMKSMGKGMKKRVKKTALGKSASGLVSKLRRRGRMRRLYGEEAGSPGEAFARLEAAQEALHLVLYDYDPVLESLFDLSPALLVDLCRRYAIECSHLMHLHVKAFFRSLLSHTRSARKAAALLSALPRSYVKADPENLISSTAVATGGASGVLPHSLLGDHGISSSSLDFDKPLSPVGEELDGDLDGSFGQKSSATSPAHRATATTTNAEETTTRNEFTYTEALDESLTKLMTLVRVEETFFESYFRLDKADEKVGSMFPGMASTDGAATGRVSFAVDTPTPLASLDNPWLGVPESRGLIMPADELACDSLTTLWDKLWQKLKFIANAPQVATSAELLTMLCVVHNALGRFEPPLSSNSIMFPVDNSSPDAEDAAEDDDGDRPKTSVSEFYDKTLVSNAFAVNVASPINTRVYSKWISARLRELSATLLKRWRTFIQETVSWISTQLGASTDVRQAGVLPPFSKFAAFVEAIETQTGGYSDPEEEDIGAGDNDVDDSLNDTIVASEDEGIDVFVPLEGKGLRDTERLQPTDTMGSRFEGAMSPTLLSTEFDMDVATLDHASQRSGVAKNKSGKPARKPKNRVHDGFRVSREVRDSGYKEIVAALFSGLERAAAANTKYADVVRLENYFYFAASISNRLPLRRASVTANIGRGEKSSNNNDDNDEGEGRGRGGIPIDDKVNEYSKQSVGSFSRRPHVLDEAVEEAETLFRVNLDRYLAWHFKYEFKEVAEFFERVQALVESRGVADVQIHESRDKLTALLSTQCTVKVLKDKFKVVLKRMQKHLASSSSNVEFDPPHSATSSDGSGNVGGSGQSLGLLPEVWRHFVRHVHRLWLRYAEHASKCYGILFKSDITPGAVRRYAREACQEVLGSSGMAALSVLGSPTLAPISSSSLSSSSSSSPQKFALRRQSSGRRRLFGEDGNDDDFVEDNGVDGAADFESQDSTGGLGGAAAESAKESGGSSTHKQPAAVCTSPRRKSDNDGSTVSENPHFKKGEK